MSTMAQNFADYLSGLLQEKRWRIATLAEKSGVSISYLYRIIKQRQVVPSPAVIHKLAPALGVHEDALMVAAGYTVPPQPEELALVRQLQMKPTLRRIVTDALNLPEEDLEELDAIIQVKKRRQNVGTLKR
jgi:transcriptional regulator with XRE-family HTH domain